MPMVSQLDLLETARKHYDKFRSAKRHMTYDSAGRPHSFKGKPAYVNKHCLAYLHHGVLHNSSGPAYISIGSFGVLLYWHINGVVYFDTEDYCVAAGFSKEETLMAILVHGNKLPTRL